jgi:hypothetical protein
MLSEETEDSPLSMAEKLLSVYSPSSEYLFEPMQIVPITKPKEHETTKEDSLRVLVQRVILRHFARSSSVAGAETPKKSRGKPVLGDLCDGFFLNKLKQLQISQYNTDKVSTSTSLGCRLITQSSPNTVTVIDVKDATKCETVLQSEGKWVNIKGLIRAEKLPIGGVSFGRIINHLQTTDEFTCAIDASNSAAINYSPASLVALDKLSPNQISTVSVLGKVLFSETDHKSLSMSTSHAHTVYVTDGKTVAPIRVKTDQQLGEGKAYLFIDVKYHDNCCHTSAYSAIEEVRWTKKSSVNYHNTNTLPGKRLLDKGVVTREIGSDDTLCAALGIDVKALEADGAVPTPRSLTCGTVARLSVKSTTAVESQLQCTYCLAVGLEPLAANTELSVTLSINAQHPQFKCTQCRTIQSVERARKAFKVQGECQLENKTIARQLYVAAALVEQWTERQKRKADPNSVIAKAVENCLCKITKEPQGLRVDVIKSIM